MHRGRDRSRVLEWHGGWEQGKGYARQYFGADVREIHNESRHYARVFYDQHFSKSHVHGCQENASVNRTTDSFDEGHCNSGNKASFYFTNIPEFMPLYRLRQYFEVCGILSDVYLARRLNARGKVYDFVRFLNVKNRDKLGHALNNIWIGDCRVWVREAWFNRFADFDENNRVVSKVDQIVVRGVDVNPVVITHGKGIRNVRLTTEVMEA